MDDLVKRLRDDALERMRGLGKPDGPAIEDQAARKIEQLHKAIRTAIDYLDHMEPDAAEVILLNAVAGCERAEGSDSERIPPTHKEPPE